MRIWGIVILFLVAIEAFAQTGCAGFNSPIDSLKVFTHRDLYRKHIAENNHKEAIYFWEYIYVNAPGSFEGLYMDGIELFKHLYQNEADMTAKQLYLERIFEIYDFRTACYPKRKGYILTRKGYDMVQLDLDKVAAFETFKKGVAMESMETKSFALPPYAKVTEALYKAGKIDNIERIQTKKLLQSIANYHINGGTDTKGNYETALVYVNKYFGDRSVNNRPLADRSRKKTNAVASTTPKQNDCDYFIKKYKAVVDAEPSNHKLKEAVYQELEKLGCASSNAWASTLLTNDKIDKMTLAMNHSGNTLKSASPITEANYALKMGDYDQAVTFYKEAITGTTDNVKRSQLHLKIAEILFYKKENAEKANYHALAAANFNSNWGKPYIFLGDIYVASTRSCYPNDVVMQKLIVQAAINQWTVARQIDSNATKEASERIKKYSSYLPTRSEIFLHKNLKEGKTVKIGCWIQKKIKVKAK